MESTELIITQEAGKISCNYEEVKQALDAYLDDYRNIQFDENAKTMAKNTVASLRKEKKAASDILKEKKAAYLAPFEAVEKQVKQLIGMYDEPIDLINDQINKYENMRKENKRKEIRDAYEKLVSDDLKEYIPLDKIYDNRWENATFSIVKVQEALSEINYSTRRDIESLKMMECSGDEKVRARALEIYKKGRNFQEAVSYITQYNKQLQEIRQREQERIRREEEERIRREEREKMEAERQHQEEQAALLRKAEEEKAQAVENAKAAALWEINEADKLASAPDEPIIPFADDAESDLPFEVPNTVTAFYKIVATPAELQEVEIALDSLGVTYERRDG